MALQKQQSPVKQPVSVDFPQLPRVPNMTITKDHDSMQMFQAQLDSWYSGLRTVILDKLNSIKKG